MVCIKFALECYKKCSFCFLPNIHLYNKHKGIGIVLVVVIHSTEYTLNVFIFSRMFL